MCMMDNFDTEKFIIDIQNRPSIWDSSSADYSNRDLKKKCWEEIMAMATNFVTLGELWSSHVEMEEEDEAIFSRIKVLIENHLPDGWRDWKKEDLFGKKIDHKVLNKIRFALPTLELVKAFYPEATSIADVGGPFKETVSIVQLRRRVPGQNRETNEEEAASIVFELGGGCQ
ncbi:unnamed protein product [Acanthoscelides obtectus]|uniref:MADF domain-containing protein n=1 Tax=Acanthoscelides obtectus TaxID=200917 RepID=A0A9P0KLN9_ACAOB|nr:unnamed protein product [Acanthoscelides obtectus]CAK1641668.1 hypothetical protein AOBTE_LOCUS12546 [Acanthoscelides obtectus]